jgi:molybdopterin molybdotransferase
MAAPGQIQNSNGPMLVAAAARASAAPMELGIARDDRDDLKRWVEQGLAADVLILSGGVSAGKFDLVPSVLAELGVEQVFHKISLRPGKPLWFGVKHLGNRSVLVFGLPGNPVSSLVCFELFVRPAIAALSGRDFARSMTVKATLSHAYDHSGGRAACLPARISECGEPLAMPAPSQSGAMAARPLSVEILPWQGSADLAALAKANGLARLSDKPGRLEAGTRLDVVPL